MSVKPGVDSVGPSGFGEVAQGQFVLVRVNVTNTGNKSQLMDDNSQVAFDAANKEYKPNSMAGIEVNGASSLFLQEINPGNTVRRYAGVRCS